MADSQLVTIGQGATEGRKTECRRPEVEKLEHSTLVCYIHNFYIHCILRSGPYTLGPILHSDFLPSVFYI